MMENPDPKIIEKSSFQRERRLRVDDARVIEGRDWPDALDEQEIFDWIKNLKDPEYPLTLEELKVIDRKAIIIDTQKGTVRIEFTPTVPHCSQATLIGLMLKCVLHWSLPRSWKVDIKIKEGTHTSESSINKQLADKERIAAALENPKVLNMIVRGVLKTRTIDEVVEAHIMLPTAGNNLLRKDLERNKMPRRSIVPNRRAFKPL